MSSLSFSEKLIKLFTDNEDDEFNTKEVVDIIREFSKEQYKTKLEEGLMPFGKYKFKKIKDIVSFDKQYIEWLLKQSMMEKKGELKEEIEKYL